MGAAAHEAQSDHFIIAQILHFATVCLTKKDLHPSDAGLFHSSIIAASYQQQADADHHAAQQEAADGDDVAQILVEDGRHDIEHADAHDEGAEDA